MASHHMTKSLEDPVEMIALKYFYHGCSTFFTANKDFKACLLLFGPSRIMTIRLCPEAMALGSLLQLEVITNLIKRE